MKNETYAEFEKRLIRRDIILVVHCFYIAFWLSYCLILALLVAMIKRAPNGAFFWA